MKPKIIRKSYGWKLLPKSLINDGYEISGDELLTDKDIERWSKHLQSRSWPSYLGFEDIVYYAKNFFRKRIIKTNRCEKCNKKIEAKYQYCYACYIKNKEGQKNIVDLNLHQNNEEDKII